MKKLIFEEIDRIKEIMGLKLISEGRPVKNFLETILDFVGSARGGTPSSNINDFLLDINEMQRLGRSTPNFDSMINSLDKINGGNLVTNTEAAEFLTKLKQGIAPPDQIKNFVNGLMSQSWTTDFGRNAALKYLQELNSYVFNIVDDVNFQSAFTDFNNGSRNVITDQDFGDITDSFINLRNNFESGTPLWDEVSDMYNRLTKRDLDATNLVDNAVDDAVDDVAEASVEEIERPFITAEESVISQAKQINIVDGSGNLKSKAAGQKKSREVVDNLKNKPQDKWTEQDYAWVSFLNGLGLITEADNKLLYNQLPSARELIELRKLYLEYKQIAKNRNMNAKTFQKWLNDNNYKYPKWATRRWSKIIEGFDNFTKHYSIVFSGKFDKQWWKSLGIVMLHVGLIIGGPIAAAWQLTKRAGEKASDFFDSLIDMEPEEIQTAINEFFDYDSPKIDGIDVYSSDNSGAFNADNYKRQAPFLDEIINADKNTISLKTYVMVNGKYCRSFEISVSQAPFAGSENFLPHEMSKGNFTCDETPNPKYMPGGSANSDNEEKPKEPETFENWLTRSTEDKANPGGGGWGEDDYEVVSGSSSSGEITVKINDEEFTAKLVNNKWEWQ